MQARLLSVDDDIKPVIEYLESLGLDRAKVKQVCASHCWWSCTVYLGPPCSCKLLHNCTVCTSPNWGPASGLPDPTIYSGTAA